MRFTFICVIVIKYLLSTVSNPNNLVPIVRDRLIQIDLSFQGGGRDRLINMAIINMYMIPLSSILFLLFSALPVFNINYQFYAVKLFHYFLQMALTFLYSEMQSSFITGRYSKIRYCSVLV